MPIVAAEPCWHAEITLGVREGYGGPEIVTPAEAISVIQEWITGESLDPWFAVIVWSRGTVVGRNFAAEGVLRITTETNPIYTPKIGEREFAKYLVALSQHLGSRFKQVRVYYHYYPVYNVVYEP